MPLNKLASKIDTGQKLLWVIVTVMSVTWTISSFINRFSVLPSELEAVEHRVAKLEDEYKTVNNINSMLYCHLRNYTYQQCQDILNIKSPR